jgi:hypothetical protein
MLISLIRFPGAISYEIRAGVAQAGGALPTTWTITPVPQIKSPTTIIGLTPVTVYVFQARAVLKTGGYSEWGDPIARVVV